MSRHTGFTREVRDLIIGRARGCCEICGEWFSDMQAHHRRPRGMGGTRRLDTNAASGGLWLCGEHHRHVESHRSLAYDNGWLVRQSHTPAEVPVWYRDRWVLLGDDGSVIPVRDEAIR